MVLTTEFKLLSSSVAQRIKLLFTCPMNFSSKAFREGEVLSSAGLTCVRAGMSLHVGGAECLSLWMHGTEHAVTSHWW